MNKQIDEWFAKSFHGTAVSQDTPIYNAVHAATEDLKGRLTALSEQQDPPAPAAIVDAWATDCIAGNSVMQRSGCGEIITAAVEDLRTLFA
jgi:hypothetical protein